MATINTGSAGGSQADPRAVGAGFKNWSYAPEAASAAFALTSGNVYLNMIYLPPGTVCSNIFMDVSTGSSGTVTGLFVGLCTLAGVMVAQSANLGAASPFTVGGQAAAGALSASYTTNTVDSATGNYYIVTLQNGAFSVTNPTFQQNSGQPCRAGSSPPQYGSGVTGAQTALPANGASIAGGIQLPNGAGRWYAVS